MSTDSTREFHVIVWGATGYTGELAAEYLASRYPPGDPLRWAIAGRNADKLKRLKEKLVSINPPCESLQILTLASNDVKSLNTLTSRTQAILAAVGPYDLLGEPVVASCVEQSTDYCDITGEPQFIERMIEKYHESAKARGVKIVHCCGFDSVPADIGALVVASRLREQKTKALTVKTYYKMKGSMSSGTMLSILNVMQMGLKTLRRLSNPYLLLPPALKQKRKTSPLPEDREQTFIKYEPDIKKYTMPWFMATINTKIVRRSAALSREDLKDDSPYGETFTYNESMVPKNRIIGFIASIVLLIGGLLLCLIPAVPRFFTRFVPVGGANDKKRAKNWFETTTVGRGEAPSSRAWAVIKGADAYAETAKMAAEAAICLSLDKKDLPQTSGILTPASGLGMRYVDRLKKAGISIDVFQ